MNSNRICSGKNYFYPVITGLPVIRKKMFFSVILSNFHDWFPVTWSTQEAKKNVYKIFFLRVPHAKEDLSLSGLVLQVKITVAPFKKNDLR